MLVNHVPKAIDLQAVSSVLPASLVGYHAGKPIESVVYCLYKITLRKMESTGSLSTSLRAQ